MRRILIILLIIPSLFLTGCVTDAKPAKKAKKPRPSAAGHSLNKAQELILMKHTRENLDVIMAARDDTTALQKALTGQALKDMSDRIAADKAAGKIKVRRYDDLELSPENYTNGIAGVAVVLTDNSYLASVTTKKALEKPSGRKLKLLLALKKIKSRWMIIEIFSREVKPAPR